MKVTIDTAKKAAQASKAKQVVIVAFDGTGRFAVTSYGKTQNDCRAVRPLGDAIADRLLEGELPAPVEVLSHA